MSIVTSVDVKKSRERLAYIAGREAQLLNAANKTDNKAAYEELHVIFREKVDLTSAIKAYEQSTHAKYDKYFDDAGSSSISIPESLKDSVITRLAERAAHTMEIPIGTTFLTLMGGAAAAVATNYVTQFRTGTRVPAVLHVAAEHPPSTGKSNLVSLAISPYMKAMIDHNKRIGGINKSRVAEDKNAARLPEGFVYKTDATSAAIDAELSELDSGRIVIAASEQAAFQSLFPETGGYSSNNSLMLNGWMGEYIAGSRTTRKAYSGFVQSSVLLIAQVGSIQRVLAASNQTGLAERFLFAIEPTNLGSRTRNNGYLSNEDKAAFNLASATCVKNYSRRVKVDEEDSSKIVNETDIQSLECLRPSDEGYDIIKSKLIEIEPFLGELNRSGEMTFLGWLGKLETHVLKIAVVLHVFDCLGSGCKVPEIIPSRLIQASIELVFEIGKHMRGVIQQSGEAGDAAEVESVLDLVRDKRVTVTSAKTILRKRSPFRARQADAYRAAGLRISAMLSEGMLVVSTEDGSLKIV